MPDILVIGGGAAGCLAAIAAARAAAKVTVWEKNGRLGKKLAITGKGRCNVTNACPLEELIQNLPGNGRFLYSAFHRFSNEDAMGFFEELGVPLKVERGQRVFPVSDQASSVVEALEKEMLRLGILIRYHTVAKKLLLDQEQQKIIGAASDKGDFYFDAVIVTTGGCTYTGTGSTGDGYGLAKQAGHRVTPLRPSLVPLVAKEDWLPQLAGLSLKNVQVTLWAEKTGGRAKLADGFGEMLFTHFGLSGPLILAMSRAAADYWEKQPGQAIEAAINLKPALTEEQLDQRLQRDFQKFSRKQFGNALGELLPKSLIPVMILLSGIPAAQPVHQITKQQRQRLLQLFRAFPVTITGARPMNEGIVTAGGVCLKEINPKTFQSKLVGGLYFAGEVLDIDGFTGGYNLQAAFSSGYVAGEEAAWQG